MPTVETRERIADELRAGDLWTWKESAPSDFPAASYTLKYELQGPRDQRITITGATSGADYLFTVNQTANKVFPQGTYRYIKYFEQTSDTTQRFTVEEGRIEILPNLAAVQGGYDARTKLEKSLDQVEDAIVNYSLRPVDQMTIGSGIGSRTLIRPKLSDLIKVRNWLKEEIRKELRAEKIKRGEDPGGRILVRMGAIS